MGYQNSNSELRKCCRRLELRVVIQGNVRCILSIERKTEHRFNGQDKWRKVGKNERRIEHARGLK